MPAHPLLDALGRLVSLLLLAAVAVAAGYLGFVRTPARPQAAAYVPAASAPASAAWNLPKRI